MSYCRFGPDSDVYVYESMLVNGESCWVLMLEYDDEPHIFMTRAALHTRLLELEEIHVKVPADVLMRLWKEEQAEL